MERDAVDRMHSLFYLVEPEINQLREEGCNIEALAAEWEELKDSADLNLRLRFYDEKLAKCQPEPDFPYHEPSGLEEIRLARPDGPRRMAHDLRGDALYDRLYGAWLGRCAGCILGKPVESWPGKQIRDYLKLAGAFPLENYIPMMDPMPQGYEWFLAGNPAATTRGNIAQMVRDDDTDYTIVGLRILETYGLDFTPADVANFWLEHLPFRQVYTAERMAYRNFVNGIMPPLSATYRNPYREWIGAQIRADSWGYAAPGWPEKAAEFAWRDASISHVKNGIYGEMWAAAMIAAAFATDDPEEIIEIGLSEIPQRSRLAEAIRSVLQWHDEGLDWLAAWERINEAYGVYHWVHTINNACIVALALLWGEGDFGRTISIAVMGGWDTDCNGATVGSICGAMLGAKALPQDPWIAPLNDTINSFVLGEQHNKISDLARRSLTIAEKVVEV